MKIKLDENMPATLRRLLAASGHDVQTAAGEGLTGAKDLAVWERAQREGRFFITQDLDFADLGRFTPGTHHGLLLVRLHAPSRQALIARIEKLLETEGWSTWERCFVVVTERKIRIRRPEQ